MSRSLSALALALGALAAACQPEVRPTPHPKVDPPVASAGAIPDAPVGGTLRGARFLLRDARYVPDHRTGYHHTDIKLSAGSAEAACGEVEPAGSSSVWLRLERSDSVETQELRLEPGKESPWSVHYQVREEDAWVGSSDGSAVVSLRAPSGDGTLSGAIAVCFADGARSCVSGSFEARPCPPAIDAPVRGAIPSEAIPEKYRAKAAGSAPMPPAPEPPAPVPGHGKVPGPARAP
jgi:hypothetical protein